MCWFPPMRSLEPPRPEVLMTWGICAVFTILAVIAGIAVV
jgi:hypothetical protein